MAKNLTFQNFDDIQVSTKTFTANTNLLINLDKVFDILPIAEYTVVQKKRGRKKKTETVDPNKNIEYGSIITLKYQGKLRGVDLKAKKSDKNWFRNSFTTVIVLDKIINFKVCKNGTFQMTGCKSKEHAIKCVQIIWEYIKDYPELYKFTRGKNLEVLFIPCMRNVDFSLGFFIDREKLNKYMKEQTEFYCLLETSFGYTGVSVKVPLEETIQEMPITKLSYKNNEWIQVKTVYQEYLNTLTPREQEIKITNERFTTFLIFQSGKVILSSLTKAFAKPVYYKFLELVKKAFDQIEERLEVD
jgi:TATA-box binding protein (TBP) (component of TFIID and TFIIIB)